MGYILEFTPSITCRKFLERQCKNLLPMPPMGVRIKTVGIP